MKNTINLYEDKRRSKLYVRYRINGTSRDETLQLEWHSNVWMDKHIKINNKSKKLAEEFALAINEFCKKKILTKLRYSKHFCPSTNIHCIY